MPGHEAQRRQHRERLPERLEGQPAVRDEPLLPRLKHIEQAGCLRAASSVGALAERSNILKHRLPVRR